LSSDSYIRTPLIIMIWPAVGGGFDGLHFVALSQRTKRIVIDTEQAIGSVRVEMGGDCNS
jgi:hypothetical protein